jgi:hypothetical protein
MIARLMNSELEKACKIEDHCLVKVGHYLVFDGESE